MSDVVWWKMLIPVISFLTIVNFKGVQSLEAVLMNGSLTIVDFNKACENAGFKTGERKISVEHSITVSIREIDPLFGVILNIFCPYVGFYPVNVSSNVNKTEPLSHEIISVKSSTEIDTLNSLEHATESTTEHSTLKDKFKSSTLNTHDKLFSSDLILDSLAMLHDSESAIVSNIIIIENVTESSALKILGENASTYMNVTSTPDIIQITDILTARTVPANDDFIVNREKTIDEHVTESITSKINNENEVVSGTEMNNITVTIALNNNATTLMTSDSYAYKNNTPIYDKQSLIVPTEPQKLLTVPSEKTDITYTESEKHYVSKKTDTEIVTNKEISNNLNTNQDVTYKDISTLRVERKDKDFNESEENVSLTKNVLPETSIPGDQTLIHTSLPPAVENIIITTTDKIEYATKGDRDVSVTTEYAALKDNYLIVVASETFKLSTNFYNNDDEDYADMEETKGPDSMIINSTVIYKHDIESMDKRRSVIVFFFVTILLILMAVWSSRAICMRKKGTYVLPQNLDDNIELRDNAV